MTCLFKKWKKKTNNSTHVNSISSTYISSTNTNIIDKHAHTHTPKFSPPTLEKNPQSAHPHTQRTDIHIPITQIVKWAYHICYLLPQMKRILLMYAAIRRGTVYIGYLKPQF